MPRESTVSVGGKIVSLCTKCKEPHRHVVVSLVEGQPARVQCTFCGSTHNFRNPKAGKARSQNNKTGAGEGTSAGRTPEAEWLAVMRGLDPKQAVPYGGGGRPRQGDLVEHPSFGFGLVVRTVPPGRVEVRFRDGLRRLRWPA